MEDSRQQRQDQQYDQQYDQYEQQKYSQNSGQYNQQNYSSYVNNGQRVDTSENNSAYSNYNTERTPVETNVPAPAPVSGSNTSSDFSLSSNSGGDSLNDKLLEPIADKNSLIIIVFGGAILLYILISAIIYISSYIIKNKEDDLTEDFYKEITKEKKENNQFFMDPALHKSPAIKAAEENEEKSYRKFDNKDDYDHIWDNFIVTGKKDDIEIDVNKGNEYPITTPVTPVSPSPLQQSFTNDSYNMTRVRGNSDSSNTRNMGHRESNSTSSTASVSNLIPKNQKIANEEYNEEMIPYVTPPAPAHHQFPNGRASGPQVKFTMDQKSSKPINISSHHDNRNQLTTPSPHGSNNCSPRSPQPRSPQPRSPQPRSPQPRSPQPRSPQPRSPQPRSPKPRGPEHKSSNGNMRSSSPRVYESQGSNGSIRLSPNVRNPNLEHHDSNGNMRHQQNQRPRY
ncbi:hypothetical protein BCR36DRAFT_407173 [Piromyces finnis]|uniref:Uncharacterized protein n=1 Tax=Piromyces finnis TaxID=1754191 RepID=A0A1Y1UVS1_9FUNG|nr:hypothetical protein BCR36DRAFT_407173 [Piromyces finnis]|eukprot:ORX42159.1 hypothetical protein BCR36DRAFT_407173 [Piromyces finnis]